MEMCSEEVDLCSPTSCVAASFSNLNISPSLLAKSLARLAFQGRAAATCYLHGATCVHSTAVKDNLQNKATGIIGGQRLQRDTAVF